MKTNFYRAVSTYDKNSEIQFSVGKNLIEWLLKFIKVDFKNSFENFSHNNFQKKILDIGCGTGKLTKLLSAKLKELKQNKFDKGSFKIDAIDISKEMIQYAKQNNFCETINFNCSSIEDNFFQKNSEKKYDVRYDIIFSNAVLHWLEDLNSFFCNLKKISHQKSRFFFSIYTDGTFQELTSALKKEKINYQIKIPYLSVETIIDLLKENFIIHQKQQNSFPEEFLDFNDFQRKQHLVGSFKTLNFKNNFNDNFSNMKRAILFLKQNFNKPFFLTYEILSLEISLKP